MKHLEGHDQSYVLERWLKAVERLLIQCECLPHHGRWYFRCNNTRMSQHHLMCLDCRISFPLKLPRSLGNWCPLSQPQLPPLHPLQTSALSSTTHQQLLLLNELHIASLETWSDSFMCETRELSRPAKSLASEELWLSQGPAK